jgi:hypothetical protein
METKMADEHTVQRVGGLDAGEGASGLCHQNCAALKERIIFLFGMCVSQDTPRETT